MKHINKLIFLAILLFGVSVVNASSIPISMYQKNFIPFWSQAKRGHEVALLNTNHIIEIRPFFNPSVESPTHKDIVYLQVDLVNGKTLEVHEDFEKFYGRVRVSQAK